MLVTLTMPMLLGTRMPTVTILVILKHTIVAAVITIILILKILGGGDTNALIMIMSIIELT